jgi:hypothetical protein
MAARPDATRSRRTDRGKRLRRRAARAAAGRSLTPRITAIISKANYSVIAMARLVPAIMRGAEALPQGPLSD